MCYDYVTAVRKITELIKDRKRENIMKKKLAVLLTLMMSVASLAACGGDNATTETSSTELAVYTPSVEIVSVEGDTLDLSALPVEEYVTLGEYKGMTINVTPKTEVTDEMIDSSVLDYYYQHGATYLTAEEFLTEGTVAETDFALIDYEGKKDGVAFDGGTATDAVLGIGSGTFIDGFESGLVGVKVGETVDLNLTFPESYGNTELAGQAVVFTVTVKGIVNFDDDTIAKLDLDGITTMEDYREAVSAMLTYEVENIYYSNLSAAICDALVGECEVTKIPESIFNAQKAYAEEQIGYEAYYYYGVDGELYAQVMSGMSLSDYASSIAEAYTIQAVIFQAIANAEGIDITQEEIDTFVNNYVANYGPDYGIESVDAFYENNTVEDVKTVLLQEKIMTFMTENSTIVDAE